MRKLTLDRKFERLIIKLQKARDKNPVDFEKRFERLIYNCGKTIRDEKLIDKCIDKDFAKQLCMKNDIPEEFYN